ncbi:acyl-CoA dehydrogenase family protein [Actinophytocola oryzae]|uniref:Acyl-CoA dehydrogenase-like protein n=1 Tax=Actinophytocola oryzae TaxID=502181 RepID=A0A4R7VYT0_9PSEU|nr:acyl-CoA dehydrogenase family protein [Actinophytocola oryzae]TDV54818.1 acyl-CoA dehydrogenase-like protein [Actinophytocola oryzae]
MSSALTVDIADYERVGYSDGLAAGLVKVLRDLSDADVSAVAPGRFVAVPTERASGATVGHSMVQDEGIAILDLRQSERPTEPSGCVLDVGLRLAAVRVGLTRCHLDAAVEHLTGRTGGGEPLIRKQLNQGSVADVLAGVEMLRRYLETTALDPTNESIVDIHAQLTALDWEVTKLFGASGYMADHPVRALYVADLVANTWVCKGEQS